MPVAPVAAMSAPKRRRPLRLNRAMSHTVTIARAARGSILVPAGEIEIYLINGWRLTDEPGCDGARMLPPSCIHRVSDNGKAGRGGTREPA
ncbi:MAG: hypothetical protein JSR61_02700 [Proteobacteria bacterium]|nr:hypothetical protein [Pseudomonadota bacterium]